ncbi:MAG: DNRLRE domain-containing protein [Phycisphaeraceae bacterium]|nr:DNRLRE domain-containing protein [Phycisphaeraceae bacterium]
MSVDSSYAVERLRPIWPVDGREGVSPRPVLAIEPQWAERRAVLATQWQVGADAALKHVLYDRGVFDTWTHVAMADLPLGRLCYWRARVMGETGWSAWSEAGAFRTCEREGLRVHVLQDGYRGYEGTRDADIRGDGRDPSRAVREWNQGRQDVLRTGRRGVGLPTDEIQRSLLRFDVRAFTDAEAVVSAYLVLTGWEHDRRDPAVRGQGVNRVYRVRRAWNEGTGVKEREPLEGEVSWTYSQYPHRWAAPGAAGQSDDPEGEADIEATALGECTVVSRVGAKMVFSSPRFVEAVRSWIREPGGNHGILLRCVDESARGILSVASREHPAVSYRPKLVVESYERSGLEGEAGRCYAP